jgi:hypothetical protein
MIINHKSTRKKKKREIGIFFVRTWDYGNGIIAQLTIISVLLFIFK